jgi:ATP-binding cassette subfamily C (CFTR/MRP) protein 1
LLTKNLLPSKSGHDLVLKDVSLSIKAGEKIAVCGRTGSGKTSLIMSLFRMVDSHDGSIRVDGLDLATLPREDVRRRIVGLPQHPFLLKGSVRLNADPMGAASEAAIMEALRCVQLMEVVHKNGSLEADIDALNLSAGQKQLFCLARAMLRFSTILVLDEATSRYNSPLVQCYCFLIRVYPPLYCYAGVLTYSILIYSIDGKTEEIIQRLIRKKFARHTIIAVAHRLETIMDFDKVAVLDAGRLIEFDGPYALLDVPGSAFAKLYNAAVADEEDSPDDRQQRRI